ncbi:hypothetical protein [Halalkalibacter nanhaiisediminis]|uniref:Glutamate synthase (NADPH/NADH) small chain n=1 Tax=Halalkalibacter nanhaiisediminis TaxID=688079 RepID=A0A562QQE8_9BACI|nr:glutamate synthase (NADPH/NADH) small chain [Halalkalibacter nanhaiisediminis]
MPIRRTEKVWKADLILLAVGFIGPKEQILKELTIKTSPRSTIEVEYGKNALNVEDVFAARDNHRREKSYRMGNS